MATRLGGFPVCSVLFSAVREAQGNRRIAARLIGGAVLCLGLTGRASALSWPAHSKQKSLEVSYVAGRYTDTLDMNGQVVSRDKVPVKGVDVNWDFHRRFAYLSYGLVLRQRSLSAPRKKLNFTGAGVRIGFVTNTFEDPHRWPIGFHTHLSAVGGAMTKFDSGKYDQAPFSGFSDWDVGVDLLLHGWKSADGTKYRSALVASVDACSESALTTLQTKDKNNPAGGFLQTSGSTMKFGLSWYW